ncbi:MAG: ribosomal-processing cysteine protease Prp [Clostridia bacterium]|nr:ribosomal-processing cysteine protease Prp [Clostridia bacterium]
MIKAEFYHSKQGIPTGFNIKGHSGYAQAGADIVCASVSSAAYMAANTIIEIMGVKADASVDENGEMTIHIPEESATKTKDILLGLQLHLKELSKQYPKNVTITITEV